MNTAEAIRRIELAEEFAFDAQALSVISEVEVCSEEELKQIVFALFSNYWGLPKLQNHEKWADFVLDAVQRRKDSSTFYLHMLECIKEHWKKIDIRLKSKFVFLVEKIAEKITESSDVSIKQFIVKGPAAEYDIPIMRTVINNKKSLSDEDVDYLLSYLISTADTYFTNFFIQHVFPILKTRRISARLAEEAYARGNNENMSPKMRELLFSLYACKKE